MDLLSTSAGRNAIAFAKQIARRMNIGLLKYDQLQMLIENSNKVWTSAQAAYDLELLGRLPPRHLEMALSCLKQSRAQLRQDLFVLSETDFKQGGYFVEFGATDGISLSNTYLLETRFGWRGILAEPATCWHPALFANRGGAKETKCVWSRSGETLTFNEAPSAEFSTIAQYRPETAPGPDARPDRRYDVETISLLDLLDKHGAPPTIDYLSIDTEGSEFEILSHFDFGRYTFNVITCEHNFSPQRERIFALLSQHGYVRKYQDLSQFDDWYVRA